MHVVGDDRAAVGGEPAGDREVVAARRGRTGRCHRSGVVWSGQPAQVDVARGGHGRVAGRRAQQGRIPARTGVREQREQRWRQVRAQLPQREFALVAGVLQVEVHRVAGQGGVRRGPRRGVPAQQQVGPGPRAQRGEPGIDAFRVGVEQWAAIAGDGIQVGVDAGAHAVHAMAAVGVERDRAEQRGQFAGGGTPHQVHLEIALLRMQVTERAQGIGFARRVDRGHADGVAGDRDRCRQARQVDVAVQDRQAGTQRPPRGQRREHGKRREHHEDAQRPTQHGLSPPGSPAPL